MTHPLHLAFEAVLSQETPSERKKEASQQIKNAYTNHDKLPLPEFLAFAKQIRHLSLISIFSDLLDHYAPSYPLVPADTRDLSWTFFDALREDARQADMAFFEDLWQKAQAKGTTLTSPLGEVLAFSRIKHSGWFSEQGFFERISRFERQYGALPLEQVLDYESEDDQCFPDLFILRWLMANVVLSGQAQTATALAIACEKSEQDLAFDLENFWINYHEKLKEWFQKPFGQVAMESVQLFVPKS